MSPLAIRGKKTGKICTHREILWLQQYGRCHYCNRLTELSQGVDNEYGFTATIEHVLPRSRGGHNVIENKVVSCRRCNAVRNMIEHRLEGHGHWETIDVPAELFTKLLPVDFPKWKLYAPHILEAVIERMRWGQ